jgi:hypothetical protein
MDTAQHVGPRAREIERRLLSVGCDICWSPRDSSAFSVEFPDLKCADA